MQKISFAKMSGAGNDFILIDKNIHHDLLLTKELIQKLCDRHNGIGADGLITVSSLKDYAFTMEYYNADGSTGSLCGNGARCAIDFAAARSGLNGRVTFLSNGVEYSGEILNNGEIKFYFNSPGQLKLNFKVKAARQLINADFIDTGSPHVVIFIDEIAKDASKPGSRYSEINEVPVYEIGREIRYLPEFAHGTNVNFINIKENKLQIRTYERGVENETLSCGTGSAATAVISFLKGKLTPPVTLLTHGGDELIVNFKFEDKKIKELSLKGPVKTTFTGEFLLNKYL